ncbi:MAG: TolC family protein [Victivallales bacterium]|nr:TolC family protein [Victivallales bacterium]
MAVVMMGCASMEDAHKARLEHIDDFGAEIAVRHLERLREPLDLQACLEIAFAENYDVKRAALNTMLAEMDKEAALANFYPRINVTADLFTWSHQNKMGNTFTQDKTYRDFDINATMPIIMPSVWLMYANKKLGISIAELTEHYIHQRMVMDVTIAYYNCLRAEDNIAMLETQVDAAKSQAERIGGLAREGMAAAWQGEQADYQHKARRAELAIARRNFASNKAALLQTMGVSPLNDITFLRTDDTFELADESVDKLVLTALEQHPSLSIADHQIIVNENNVRSAITAFIPTLSAFATMTFTSDSIAAFNKNIYGGFRGAWDLFSGFGDRARYKTAKGYKYLAELDREATFISIMMEVIRAQNTLKNACESYELAQAAYSSTKSKYIEYAAKQKEGMVTVNDMLDAQADMDRAQAILSSSKYQRHIALATLQMAMGSIGGEWLADAERQRTTD